MRMVAVLLLLFSVTGVADSPDILKYTGELISFKYPATFQVASETDPDDFTNIYIDGPGTTSVFITVTPERYDYDLQEYSDWLHGALMEDSGMAGKVSRKSSPANAMINGKLHAGIVNYYSAKALFDRSIFQSTFYIVYGAANTYIVHEERRNRFVEKHAAVVLQIIESIKLPQ